LVHVNEGIEVSDIDAGEGATNGESFPLESARRGGNFLDSACSVALSGGSNFGELEWVIYGDCGHE
jgi:hypothetical protein